MSKHRAIHPALLAAALLCGPMLAWGQNEEDALRYSDILPGGTARSWGLGGAIGAVGGDPASASTNPAGLGLFNTSELSFTPQFEVNGADAKFNGQSGTGIDNRFSFNNISLILSSPGEKGSDWRGGVFGISFDRQASYHWDEQVHADQVPSTILQQFVQEANGTSSTSLGDAFPFTSDLAWQTYAIDPQDPLDSLPTAYVSAIPFGHPVAQDHTVSTSGRYNTTSFFYAANYLDRLYLGATLGLVGVRYQRDMVHRETTDTLDLKDLTYREQLLTTGSGVDLKVGVIGRITKNLRLGLAFHSPAWLNLGDAYSYSMETNFRTPDSGGNTSYSLTSPDGSYNYRIRTPWSVLASAAWVAGKHGLVSVDYAYKDLRQAKLNNSSDMLDSYDFSTENSAVREDFRATSSLRVGTEWRAGAWYFRGGWGIWPDGHADDDPRQGTPYMRYTAGAGFRTKHMSIDLTGVYGRRDVTWYPYDPGLVSPVQERLTDTRGMITVAFRP